jgi:uncharacterized protein (TIGR02466 family)
MQMIQIFGTWIGIAPIKNLDLEQAQEYVKTIPEQYAEGYDNGSVTVTQRLLDAPEFDTVKQELEQLTLEYVHLQGHRVERVQIGNSWGNTLKRDEPIHMHTHPNSYVSGVFYLTDGVPLNFHNPLQTEDLFMVRPLVEWKEDNEYTWQVLKVPIRAGYVILFPSKLKHHVDKSDTDYRYSIAFNSMPVGAIGDSTKELDITGIQ